MSLSVYDVHAYLYGYDELIGKPVTLELLPTRRSRKWRRGFFVQAYSEFAYSNAMELIRSGEAYAFRFVSG